MTRRQRILLAALLVATTAFLFLVVRAWHVPAGDGIQYWQLSQQLRARLTLAYSATGQPAFTRLPGYPLFLAFVAVRHAPLGLEEHLQSAARWNVLLHICTSLAVWWMLRMRGVRGAWAALVATLLCPFLVLLTCYGLSETLATTLATVEVALAVRAMSDSTVRYAALAGVVAGLAQLVRADAVTVAPAVLAALALAEAPRRTRAIAILVCGLCAGAVFAPWPARNLSRFGAPHFEGHQWPAQDGGAPPVGVIHWMRTWSASKVGEAYIPFRMVNHGPVYPGNLTPQMWDDEAEHQRVAALFRRYDEVGLSPEVDQAFERLAVERAHRAPWRTWVTLPLGRLCALWSPVPEYELPMRVAWLGLPRGRWMFGVWELLASALALVGAVALWRWDRRLLAVALLPIVTRSVLHSLAVPHGVTMRYLVEALPMLVLLAGVGMAALARVGRRERSLNPVEEQGRKLAP